VTPNGAYGERVAALPGVRAWIDAALAEKDFLDFQEPYRLQRYPFVRGGSQFQPHHAASARRCMWGSRTRGTL